MLSCFQHTSEHVRPALLLPYPSAFMQQSSKITICLFKLYVVLAQVKSLSVPWYNLLLCAVTWYWINTEFLTSELQSYIYSDAKFVHFPKLKKRSIMLYGVVILFALLCIWIWSAMRYDNFLQNHDLTWIPDVFSACLTEPNWSLPFYYFIWYPIWK